MGNATISVLSPLLSIFFRWLAHLDIGVVVLPEGRHNVEDNVRNRRNDRVLLPLSVIQRNKQAILARQDPVETGKDFIAELGLLF